MTSVEYYNQNATAFYERTIHADMSAMHEKFLSLLPSNARILDAGCGVGRDTKHFHDKGHQVTPFDASIKMVKQTEQLVGIQTLHMYFEDLNFSEEFDGIWASASLLHVPYEELRDILISFHKALKSSGVLYVSFKYGDSYRHADHRHFYDMNEQLIQPYLDGLFKVVDVVKRADTRSRNPSPEKAWLTIFCQKSC